MADCLLRVLRHEALQFSLGGLVFEKCRVSSSKVPANSAQALDALISTMRTASIRGFGGSTPNRVGRSPLSTQRQNFLSAVTIRC